MRAAILLTVLTLMPPALTAQEPELRHPSGWQLRFDRAGTPDSAVYFVEMPPGWHITTGPACILYEPQRTAAGRYVVRAKIFLFDPGRRREGFGLFIGGRDLAGATQAYTYFLIRRDGRFLVKQRRGSETTTLVPWTEHVAIVPHAGGEGTAENVLEVQVGPAEVAFRVNRQQVAALPRDQVLTDGVIGLRVNHALNLHVAELVVERHP